MSAHCHIRTLTAGNCRVRCVGREKEEFLQSDFLSFVEYSIGRIDCIAKNSLRKHKSFMTVFLEIRYTQLKFSIKCFIYRTECVGTGYSIIMFSVLYITLQIIVYFVSMSQMV